MGSYAKLPIYLGSNTISPRWYTVAFVACRHCANTSWLTLTGLRTRTFRALHFRHSSTIQRLDSVHAILLGIQYDTSTQDRHASECWIQACNLRIGITLYVTTDLSI